MDIEQMKGPQTRCEFERNMYILREKIMGGKYHFPMGYPAESLLKVRCLPNKRIDINSIDVSARLQANSLAHFEHIDFEGLTK